jgi:hypothetical protein
VQGFEDHFVKQDTIVAEPPKIEHQALSIVRRFVVSKSIPKVSQQSIPQDVPPLPMKVGKGLLRRWWIVAIALLGCSLGTGALSIFILLRQPPKPQCDRVFWPFASGSLRLYCAQEWAQKRTLEDLFAAIALIDGLPSYHPLRPLIDRWVDIWSKQALNLADEEFQKGDIQKAIDFAKKIPAQTTAHALVEQKIKYWNTVWAKGKGIFQKVDATLKDEDWRQAFGIMVQLLTVDNRYWSQVQYESLNQRIIVAQQDETQLVKAQKLAEAGGIDNLNKALGVLQDLSDGTIFKKSIQKLTTKIARSLVDIAESSLNKQDLNTALNALQQIPREVSFWPEVQDWIDIANAMSNTWSGEVTGYEAAIAQLKKMSPDRPLYSKAQDYIQKWSGDIGYVRLLQDAQAKAADGTPQGLAFAIQQASQIPSDSTQWENAKQFISDWSASLSDQQDQPILNRADELSFKGDSTSLQAAIQEAQRIAPGSSVYKEAQSRIKDWQNQLNPSSDKSFTTDFGNSPTTAQDSTDGTSQNLLREAKRIAQKGTPSALASAIETANQIPVESSFRDNAQQAIDDWGNKILNLAIRRANDDRNEAIAIAQQIPSASSAYDAAQKQIRDWQGSQ